MALQACTAGEKGLAAMSEDFFASPPFKPVEALTTLKRQLRDLRVLAERGHSFEWHGMTVLELALDDQAIVARLAKRPARTPEWATHSLKASTDLRRFMDNVKQQVARWGDE